MELFTKLVNGWANFAKNSILDIWQGSEYAFIIYAQLSFTIILMSLLVTLNTFDFKCFYYQLTLNIYLLSRGF